MALTWDFARQLDPAATPGSTISYFDMMTQSLYIDAGQIRTQIAKLDHGHWADLDREPEAIISDAGYGVLDIEHNFNGSVFGIAQHGADIVLLLYEYMIDVSTWIDSGEWGYQPDNPIKVGTITVKNADCARFEDNAHTLFSPGSRVRLRYIFGDSDPQDFGLFFIEDSPYTPLGTSFAFRGRNPLGFHLSSQTFDERTEYTGTRTACFRQMLLDAGIPEAMIMVEEDTTPEVFTFEASKNYFAGISEATVLVDWYFDDLPDGTVVIGSAAYIKANAAKTGIHSFNLGPECKSRSVSRQSDGVYSRICVRRKGDSPLSVYANIPYFEGWYVGSHRTFYQDVPDATDQTTMERIRDQLVECMQYSGIIETFEGPLRPWLQIGDVAIVTDAGETRILGIITDIKHRWGEKGFFTTFTVTSGGVISNPDNPATVATKYVNRLGGANRQRRITDYLLKGSSNTLAGARTTGDRGAAGAQGIPGPEGDQGPQGASAYEVWLTLGNTGTEQDFIDSLTGTGSGLPDGGTTGQVLKKASATDGDVVWGDGSTATNGIPTGGAAGQILAKDSTTDYDASWIDHPSGAGSGALTEYGTQRTVSNTTTETTVFDGYTLRGGQMDADSSLALRIIFDLVHYEVCTTTIRVKLGATTISIPYPQGNAEPIKMSMLELVLANAASTGSQRYYWMISYKDGTGRSLIGGGSTAIDTTTDQALSVTVQHSVASAGCVYTQYHTRIDM